MGYTTSGSMVRVDFFKPSGKWYTTEALDMTGFYAYQPSVVDAVREALRFHLKDRLKDMDAVVLEPYHERPHPVCIRAGDR